MSSRRTTCARARTRQPARLSLEALEHRIVPVTTPVSLADPSVWGNTGALKASSTPSISADGQLICFSSDADNLVPNDTNGLTDTFVYNRTTGAVTLVSVGLTGYAAGSASDPVISPDGRYVVFENGNDYRQQPVVAGITSRQLYLRDLQTGTTALMSVNAAGTGGANAEPTSPVFSADSKHVAFICDATNLVTGISTYNSYSGADIYERDLAAGTNKLVSVSLDGTQNGNADSGNSTRNFALSADGRFVAFHSSASNLVSISNSGIDQVYVRDMVLGITTMVSVEKTGLAGAAGHSAIVTGAQFISADGRYVAFHSGASNVLEGVGGNNSYLRDLKTGTTALISASGVTGAGVGGGSAEILSPDGRWSAFITTAQATALPTNGKLNVYVRNNLTGAVTLVSVNKQGTAGGNAGSGVGLFFDFPGNLSFSADGRYLSFRSLATDLTDGVATSHRNLYVRDLVANRTILLTPNAGSTDGGDDDSDTAVLSADGRVVAFQSKADNLVAADFNHVQDVFVRDVAAGTTAAASVRSPLVTAAITAGYGATLSSVSADGRLVGFSNNVFYGNSYSEFAPNVTFQSTFGQAHPFVRDRQTGAIYVLDMNSAGVGIGGEKPVLTPDGRYAAFDSNTGLLPAGITAGDSHDEIVYVRDLQTNALRVANLSPDGTHDIPLNGNSEVVLTPDARYVAFTTSYAGYPGVSNPNSRKAVYLRDLVGGTTYLVSHDVANDLQIRGDSLDISLSSDGRYVVFRSNDPNLAANDANNEYDVFRWDRTTGMVELVSVNAAGTGPGNDGYNERPVVTSDGRFIAFSSDASNLVAGDTNGRTDVFLRDMQAGTTALVSRTNAGGLGTNTSFYPVLSADGTKLSFLSYATNLVTTPSAENGYKTYVRDLVANTTIVATVNLAGSSISGGGYITPDGRYVFYGSARNDIVPNFVDGNGSSQDLYIRDLQQGLNKLVTPNQSGTAGANSETNSNSFTYLLSADSSTILFDATASDLFANDRNQQNDILATTTAGYSVIRGQVYNDANGDGVKGGTEGGIRFWTVFLDADNDGALDPNEASVITDASGNYAFHGLTPGTYKVTLLTQAGWTTILPAAPGSYSVTITTDGSITTGKDFGEVYPLPDLATSGVTVSPTSGAPGQAVTVPWAVTNQGNGPAAGAWQDAVYLSQSPTLGADAQLVATVPHTGGLAKNAQYAGNATVALPSGEGTWYVFVRADRRNQVAEGDGGANKANNTAGGASPVTVSIPTLTLGTPSGDTLTATNSDRYYKVTATAGQSLLLRLASAASSGQLELYVKHGGLPTPYGYDLASKENQPGQMLTVPEAQGGIYYVLVHGVAGAARTSAFSLLASEPGLALNAIGLGHGGNTGRVTLPVFGSNFNSDVQVRLVLGATNLSPVAVDYRDASLLYATFDLSGQATGSYDVKVTQGAQSSTLPAAFQVVPGTAMPVALTLSTPTSVRTNSPHGNLVISYENPGNVDLVAPLLLVTADEAELRLPEQAEFQGGSVQFLGISPDGPAGVLRPGQRVEISLPFRTTPTLGAINFEVQVADDAASVNWAAIKDTLRPSTISAEAWEPVFANFTAAVGNTVGAYNTQLAREATALSHLGQYTGDIQRLLAFELRLANAFLPKSVLASATDLVVDAKGAPLSFMRHYMASVSSRYQLGRFGRGWADNWDVTATTDGDGNLVIITAGHPHLFERQPDGSFLSDDGVVRGSGGGYVLTQPDGIVFRFTPAGLLDYVQNRDGLRVTAGYTAGRLTSLTQSNGQSFTLTYNAQGRVNRLSASNGEVTTYAYDAAGEHLLSATTPQGTTAYTYLTGMGLARGHALASITDPDGTRGLLEYDDQGRLSAERGVGTAVVAYTFGDGGQVTLTDGNGAATTLRLDDAGQVGESVDPAGRVARFRRGPEGDLLESISPGGVRYAYTYYENGNLANVSDPLGNTETFTFDDRLRKLTAYRDARGNLVRFDHDGNGNLRAIGYADGTRDTFTFDAAGGLTSRGDRQGRATQFTFNRDGLLEQEAFPDGTTASFTYDARGNMLTATNATGTTTRTYDAAGHLTEIDYPGGRFLKFRYNAAGQRLQSLDNAGFEVNYVYDTAGRLAELRDRDGNLFVRYGHDAAGRIDRQDRGNGTFTTYMYNADGEPLHIVNHAPDGTVSSRFDYTYDNRSLPVRLDTLQGSWDYSYDTSQRLTRARFTSANPAVVPNQDLQYEYDAAGNRTRAVVNGVTANYDANPLNEYTSAGTATYTYDPNGNLLTKTDAAGTTTYTYDPQNQLAGIAAPGDTWAFQYDALGNRVAVTHNGQTTQRLIDPAGLGSVAAEYDSSGQLLSRYVTGLSLVGKVDGSGSSYYDFDALGSTVGITNNSGAYVNQYAYSPFGEVINSSGPAGNPFLYLGGQGVTTVGNGTVLTQFRAYDPTTGHFHSPDPISLGGGTNLYQYASNLPTVLEDPTGWYPHVPVIDGWDPDPNRGGYLACVEIKVNGVTVGRGAYIFLNTNFVFYPGGGRECVLAHEMYHAQQCLDGNFPTEKEPCIAQEVRAFELEEKCAISRGLTAHAKNARDMIDYLNNGGAYPGCDGKPSIGPFKFLPPMQFRNGKMKKTSKDGAADPNEIVSPAGSGAAGWVSAGQPLPYTVKFENDPMKATVAAQDVVITETLDADLDWATFELGTIQFGSTVIDVPVGLRSFATRVMSSNIDSTPLRVDVSANLDRDTGVVTWVFRSIDPATGQTPENVVAGFLPVDDATGRGQGQVSYTVRPKSSLATGTVLTAQASIVFDTNAAIATNTASNAIDATAPTASSVSAPDVSLSPGIAVSWSGTDAESGAASFDVYVSTDGGELLPWLLGTADTSGVYPGAAGHTYGFAVRPIDAVGNAGALPAAAQATAVAVGPSVTLRKKGASLELVTASNQVVLTRPLSDARPLVLTGSDAAETLTITGDFAYAGGVRFDAGAGQDGLVVTGASNVVVAASVTTVGGTSFVLNGVETQQVSNVASLTVNGTAGDDIFTIDRPLNNRNLVSGAGVAPTTFFSVPTLVVNLGNGSNSVTVNSGFGAAGLKNVTVNGGAGGDTLTHHGVGLGLPVTGGAYRFNGGAGTDSVAGSGNANWTLTPTSLRSSGGGQVLLSGVEQGRLTGGAGNNVLDATAFTGTTFLSGQGGNDTLRGGKGFDWVVESANTNFTNFTLSNTRLVGLGLGVDTLVGVNGAMLTGGAGNNTFDVSGWTLPAVLDGGAGSDLLVSTRDASQTVSDTRLTRTGTAAITLSGFENARLTGGVGNNVLDASTFSGLAQLSGGLGNDVMKASLAGSILLGGAGNDTLVGNAGRDILIGGLGIDSLSGGDGDDVLIHGTTRIDGSWAQLLAIQAEWLRTDLTAAGRIANLRNGGGLNGGTRLNAATVLDDLFRDSLRGGAGADWFWAKVPPGVADALLDREAGEALN